jgi:NADH:ubiquinone oxidoreductase subunit D
MGFLMTALFPTYVLQQAQDAVEQAASAMEQAAASQIPQRTAMIILIMTEIARSTARILTALLAAQEIA